MDILWGLFVENVERGGYDPLLVTSNWGETVVFTVHDGELLRSMGLNCVEIEGDVSAVGVMSNLQNQCLTKMWDTGADYIVWCEADQYVTKEGAEMIVDFCHSQPDGVGTVGVNYNMLWAFSYEFSHTCMFASRSKRNTIIFNDGFRITDILAIPRHIPSSECNKYILDIGYISLHKYYKKMVNHQFLWPDIYKVQWQRLYESGKIEECIRLAYKGMIQCNHRKPTPLNLEEYSEIINKVNVRDGEIQLCWDILNKM